MGPASLYSPELLSVVDKIPTCVVCWPLCPTIAPVNQSTRRKRRQSRPLRRINAKPKSLACAGTMNFSQSWCGPSCEHATRPTKTVCLPLHHPRHGIPVMISPAGGMSRWNRGIGCGADHRTEALGIAQGLCSVAIPSLNDNQQGKIIAIVVVMMFASTLAVVLRLIARYLSTAKYGYDDLFIVIALVSNPLRR